MKKMFAICLALTMLFGLASIAVAAEADTDITVKYGKADLALTLIDGFDETKGLPGFMNWGRGKMENGDLFPLKEVLRIPDVLKSICCKSHPPTGKTVELCANSLQKTESSYVHQNNCFPEAFRAMPENCLKFQFLHRNR